jgi:hypothetical protein|tara:strand:- start:1433 stop:1573 length:141 start_codon:yes stop_codon:yes gene_type:complete
MRRWRFQTRAEGSERGRDVDGETRRGREGGETGARDARKRKREWEV